METWNSGSLPILHGFHNALDRGDYDSALTLFEVLLSHDDPSLTYECVASILEEAYQLPRKEGLLMELSPVIVRGAHRQERVDILAHVPNSVIFNRYDAASMARSLAFVLLEDDERLYQTAKRGYAEFVFQLAQYYRHQYTPEGDMNALSTMLYLEKYVRPTWNILFMQLSNDFYYDMANRTTNITVNLFMEVVMASKNYCYHRLMDGLINSAGNLRMDEALEFMRLKHHDCADNRAIGILPEDLKIQIEVPFVRELLQHMTVYEIELFMRTVERGGYIKTESIEAIARTHIEHLHILKNQEPLSHSLIYFVRQSALSKYYNEDKNRVLGDAMRFFDTVGPGMDLVQERVFCSVLASQSHPKKECEHQGNMHLFEFLFKRLLRLLPPLYTYNVRIDANAIQNVLFSLHNLYTIDRQMLHSMNTIDPLWVEKILHALDLYIVTSKNLNFLLSNVNMYEELPLETKKLICRQTIVNDTGKLLCYMLGKIPDRDLSVNLTYTNPQSEFEDDKYTESFTKNSLISLTITPINEEWKIEFVHRIIPVFIEDNDDEVDTDDEEGIDDVDDFDDVDSDSDNGFDEEGFSSDESSDEESEDEELFENDNEIDEEVSDDDGFNESGGESDDDDEDDDDDEISEEEENRRAELRNGYWAYAIGRFRDAQFEEESESEEDTEEEDEDNSDLQEALENAQREREQFIIPNPSIDPSMDRLLDVADEEIIPYVDRWGFIIPL